MKDRNPPNPRYPDTSYGVTSKAVVTPGELQHGPTGMWSCHLITAPIPKHTLIYHVLYQSLSSTPLP